jgi:phage anti-repressor protein
MANMETMTKYPDNGLMARLEREFTTEEQGLFLQSFSAYLNYSPTDFVIDLEDMWEWLGYTEKGKSKNLLVKQFTEGKDYIIERACSSEQARLVAPQNGGQNRQSIMMSMRTFKELSMLAETKKAKDVRKYYLTMEEVLMTHLKEREADSVLKLMETQASCAGQTLLLENKLAKALADQRFERSRALVDAFDHMDLVYAMHVMTFPDGSILVKIGLTRCDSGLRDRVGDVSAMFGLKVAVMDVYPCEKCGAFEKFVKGHGKVMPHRYSELVNGKCKNTEVFRLPDPSLYAGVKRMMQMEVSKYERRNVRELELIVEEKRIRMEVGKTALEENKVALLAKMQPSMLFEAMKLMYAPATVVVPSMPEASTQLTEPQPSGADASPTTSSEREGGLVEAVRDEDVSFSQIKVAAEGCTVVKGRRWQLVPRDMQGENIPMPETVAHQVKKTGDIAVMTADGARVIDVKCTQAEIGNMDIVNVSGSAVCMALRDGTKAGKQIVQYWDTLSTDVQDVWLADHTLPVRGAYGRSKAVLRTCTSSGEVQKFASLEFLRKKTGVTTRTVKASARNNSAHNGYSYTFA